MKGKKQIRSNSERIILFTRYPEAGKVKTRLIPALGPEGACHLHQEMTEKAAAQLRDLSVLRPVDIEVCFEGGTMILMEEWLGADLSYSHQGPGDLGLRMSRAFQKAFADGWSSVVLIGSDCPARTPEILDQAFQALKDNDLILGPALDGGYHLIGLKKRQPLFKDIPWGSSEVLDRTKEKAQALGLKIYLLDPLRDIDHPEDLAYWEGLKTVNSQPCPNLSLIIPTLNEAATLPLTLARIPKKQSIEVLVVDGGSHDETPTLAASLGARVLRSPRGRAKQMNAGAGQAKGRMLLFLHADTFLPSEFLEHISQILSRPITAGGAFQLKLEPPLPGLKAIERLANWRARVFQLPYGDQAIFLRTEHFKALGGFKEIPIMEDVDLIRRLRRQGRIEIAPVPAVTSSRRWKQNGVWRTTLKNQIALAAFWVGISPDRLSRWYHRRKKNGY